MTSVSSKMIHSSSAPINAGVPRHWLVLVWCPILKSTLWPVSCSGISWKDGTQHLAGVANEGGHRPIVPKLVNDGDQWQVGRHGGLPVGETWHGHLR